MGWASKLSFADSHAHQLRLQCEKIKNWDKREKAIARKLQQVFESGQRSAREQILDALGIEN